jgi:ubiquitin-like modifier-activating enzyme ATG7
MGARRCQLLTAFAPQIWDSIIKNHDTSALTRFLVITFADLKKYKFYYWFAFPAFAAQPLWEIDDEWTAAEEHFSAAQLGSLTQQLSPTATATARPFFLIRSAQNDDSVEVSPVQDFAAFFADVPEQLVRTCIFESRWTALS